MISTAINRWRHSLGFGIHSPYGYQFVTRVIHPGKYRWYGYDDIETVLPSEGRNKTRREARMLLRLTDMLRPSAVFIPKSGNPAFCTAIKAAGSRIRIEHHSAGILQCDLICTNGDFIAVAPLCKVIASPGKCVAMTNVPPGWKKTLFNALPEGLMFEGKRNIIIIHHPGMQKLRYTMPIG